MRLGILGGGQLARMLALAAHPLEIKPLCWSAVAPCPTSDVSQVTTNLHEFLEHVDVITFETENVTEELIATIESSGIPCQPPIAALRIAQDRLLEKQLCTTLGLTTATYWPEADFHSGALQFPGFIKACRGGYDGRGQAFVETALELTRAATSITARPQLFEAKVDFLLECSIIAARAHTGKICFYPLTQNKHVNGILRTSRAPFAANELQQQAETIIASMLEHLNYVGILAVELFLTADGKFSVNEIAPRVHNSGHWTQDGAITSQFENHVRAVCGLPLGTTDAHAYSAMVNIIGTPAPLNQILAIPGTKYHGYNKTPFSGRKIAHVNIQAESAADLERSLAQVQSVLKD